MKEYYLLQKQNLLLRQAFFLVSLFPRAINYISINGYFLDLNIKKKYLKELLHLLRNQLLLRYQTVSEITAIDFPQKACRFRLVYSLLCYDYTSRLVVSCSTSEKGVVESSTSVFPGTGWLEREVWDLFGVFFRGNSDLRRIMTDYGFVGHPLRKDFPLTGFYEVQYDDRKKQVIYRPVSLAQEFRNFRAVNVWQQLS